MIYKKENLNQKAAQLVELIQTSLYEFEGTEFAFKPELDNWLFNAKDLIQNNEPLIALENLLDNFHEFDFPLNLEEIRLLKSIVKQHDLSEQLGHFCIDVRKLNSGGVLGRPIYDIDEGNELKKYGEILNLDSIDELIIKFDSIGWNLRKTSFSEIAVNSNWCELEFLPSGKIFTAFLDKERFSSLQELFLRLRYQVVFDE
jgi:hypothetical protein